MYAVCYLNKDAPNDPMVNLTGTWLQVHRILGTGVQARLRPTVYAMTLAWPSTT